MSDDENTLNDFFDKKSNKKKAKKTKKKDKSDDRSTNEDGGLVSLKPKPTAQKDEWNDFEAPKEKDYSNLKIADLQISEEKTDDTQESEQLEEDEDGNPIQKKEATVWNPTPEPTQPVEVAKVVAEAPVALPNVQGGKYIPPGQRRTAGMGSAPTQPMRRGRNIMPDIKDQGAFPTLGTASQAPKSTSMTQGGYTEVTKGTRSQDARQQDTRPRLDLGNRYNSLS